MSPLLEVEALNVEIPLAAGVLRPVCDVSLAVSQGETLCLVGESGCGKSLTAFALMGLLPKAARRRATTLRFDGRSLLDLRERAMADIRGQRMAMIFQDPMSSLNPCYTIGNQLEEALRRHRRVSSREARERAVYLLDRVGIPAPEGRLGQYPHQLSGGLRQRVMIAMALMCGPQLIIADEPTTALDVTIQAQILLLLADLQREFKMAIVLITHDLGVVARVAHRVAVMYAGQIVEAGTADQVFRNPLHPYTEGLLECIPMPGQTPRGAHLGSIPGMVPNLIGEIHGCRFRDRCPYAFEDCATTDVPLFRAGGGHSYRCLLPAERARRPSAHTPAAREEAVAGSR